MGCSFEINESPHKRHLLDCGLIRVTLDTLRGFLALIGYSIPHLLRLSRALSVLMRPVRQRLRRLAVERG